MLNTPIITTELEKRSGKVPYSIQSKDGGWICRVHGAVSISLAPVPGHSGQCPAVPIPKPSWPLESESWQHRLLDGGWAILQEHALALSTIAKFPEAGGRDSYLLLRANEGAINCPFCLEIAEKPQTKAGVRARPCGQRGFPGGIQI